MLILFHHFDVVVVVAVVVVIVKSFSNAVHERRKVKLESGLRERDCDRTLLRHKTCKTRRPGWWSRGQNACLLALRSKFE